MVVIDPKVSRNDKKRKLKRITLVLVVSGSLMLAGCAGKDGNNQITDATGNKTETSQAAAVPHSVLYNPSANMANGGNVVTGEDGKVYYVSTKSMNLQNYDFELKASIFETSSKDIAKADEICSANVRDYSRFSGLQLLDNKPLMLQVNQRDSISNICLVGENPFSNAGIYITIPEGSEAQMNDLVISDYIVSKDCIYYALSSYALQTDIAGIYKYDMTTHDTQQVVALNGISQLLDVDGSIYAVTQDWQNTASSIYKVEAGNAKKIYTSDLSYIYYLIPCKSQLYFAEQKQREFSLKTCDMQGSKAKTIYEGRDFIEGLNTYGDKLYFEFSAGAMEDGVKTSLKSISLDDFQESDVLLEGLGDPGFGIGTVEGGLIVQGVDGPLFYDVEQNTKTPMTGCKIN